MKAKVRKNRIQKGDGLIVPYVLFFLFSVLLPFRAVGEGPEKGKVFRFEWRFLTENFEKDIFINKGKENGWTEGSALELFRALYFEDPELYPNKQKMMIPYASLKILFIDAKITIARVQNFYAESKSVLLNPPGVALGDEVRVTPGNLGIQPPHAQKKN